MAKKKFKISNFDFEELGAKLCGLDEDSEYSDIESAIWEKYEMSFESFEKLVNDLIPYTVKSKSDLTESVRYGFVDHEKGYYILKAEEI